MIDGLLLTISGSELQRLFGERIERHRRRSEWCRRQRARPPEDQSEDEPLLPDHICENEAEEHEWRAEALEFIRARIEPSEMYRLGEADLAFGELLPEKPEWLARQEFEERTAIGFNLERLTKKVGEVWPSLGFASTT